MQKLITTVALSLFMLVGCVTIGNDFPSDKVNQIQIGVTTQAEIKAMFGNPWRTGVDSGDITWTYALYSASIGGKAEAKDLVIRFDSNGVVKSYSYNSTGSGK